VVSALAAIEELVAATTAVEAAPFFGDLFLVTLSAEDGALGALGALVLLGLLEAALDEALGPGTVPEVTGAVREVVSSLAPRLAEGSKTTRSRTIDEFVRRVGTRLGGSLMLELSPPAGPVGPGVVSFGAEAESLVLESFSTARPVAPGVASRAESSGGVVDSLMVESFSPARLLGPAAASRAETGDEEVDSAMAAEMSTDD
jgi:hypothetical protein